MLIYLLLLGFVVGFKPIPFKKHLLSLSMTKENENPKIEKNVTIIPVNFGEIIDRFDDAILKNIHGGNIPLPPQNEDEIEEDSFEGYLRQHFNDIVDPRSMSSDGKKIIDFPIFYLWRKEIGTVLTIEEIEGIYNTIVENKEGCDLMDFILINKIIDENDGADYVL